MCFPIGNLAEAQARRGGSCPDLQYIEAVLRDIRTANIPAPAPIEQRWTAGSRSPMSPAAGGYVPIE